MLHLFFVLLCVSANTYAGPFSQIIKSPDEKNVECVIDTDCKLVEGPCSDVTALNKNYNISVAEKIQTEKTEYCSPRDFKNVNAYTAICRDKKCIPLIDRNNPKVFYKVWLENVEECMKLPSGSSRGRDSGYCVDFRLDPYLAAIGEIQKKYPNREGVRVLFKVVTDKYASANEMFAFAMGDVYLANPKDFEIAFKETKKSDQKHLCNQTSWGLLNSGIRSGDARIVLFEKLCGPYKDSE